MKAIGLIWALILSSILSFGQINKYGHPILRNYTPEEYNGVEQNWAIIQDNRGLMYFANNDKGILEYDGTSWRTIPVEKNANVRSFAKDDQGTIYVGTVGDFGYLTPNLTTGLLEYKSLLGLLKDTLVRHKIQDIYKTYYYKGKIYFCSRQYIVEYDGKALRTIDLGDQRVYANFWTFVVNDRMYIGSYLKGLREFQNDTSIVLATGGAFYAKKNIYSMVSLSDSKVLMITPSGFFVYNQNTGESADFTPQNSYLNKLQGTSWPSCGLVLDNNQIGIGTVISEQPTFLTVNLEGTPHEIVNMEIGLQDNFVYYLYQNPNSSLWLAQELGISKVGIQSAFRRFDERSGLKGAILDMVRFKGTLYVGTTWGTFYLENDDMGFPRFHPIKNIEATTQTFLIFKDPATKREILLAGAQPGLFEINNNVAKEITFPLSKGIDFNCWKLTQVNTDLPRVYVGMAGGLTYVEYRNGEWVDASYVLKDDIKETIKYVKEDSQGLIWASTELNGVIQIKGKGKTQELKRFGVKEGLPNSSNIELYNFGDSLIASTNNGLYLFDRDNNQFVPADLFKGIDLSQGKGVHKIIETPQGFAFTRYKDVTSSWVETFSSGSSQLISTPFKYLPNKWINALWADPNGILWFGIQKELYSFDPNIIRNYRSPYNALVRRVVSKEDTILFNGTYFQKDLNDRCIVSLTQNPEQIRKLPYRFNRLGFEFCATFYEKEEDTQFSCFLEGFDESWSLWSKKPEATFTNLREGNYTFKVKARNIYGTESNVAEYKFSIAPPWYRTILAWIIYSILFIVLIWVLVRWNTRRLIAEKEALEQIVKERTAEVVAQKDEIEAQSEMISIQNEEIKSSIHYASRIQSAILTPDEQIEKIFNEYFILFLPRDIVSGDFYWITKVGTKKICVIADCTGHGVPGGFMSMLGMSFISQIISKGGELHPADILNQLRSSVINSLHQTIEVGSSKDGMDIAIYVIDEETNILEFSGANNPLVHIRNNELNHIKSDKMPIGIHLRANEPFTNYTMELKPGDCIYTFSDGYVDQF